MRGINPNQMKKAMKKMGVKQEELETQKVVMYLEDKKLVFDSPEVMAVDMMGNKTYQVVGKPQEQPLQKREVAIDKEDLETVIDQTGCTEEEAKKAIKEADYDLAQAILSLSE